MSHSGLFAPRFDPDSLMVDNFVHTELPTQTPDKVFDTRDRAVVDAPVAVSCTVGLSPLER